MANVLVTGGAGFIGSNVADEFVKSGHKVVIVDNLFSGKKENLNPDARFYKMDVRDKRILDVLKREKIEIIDHHAAQISVPDSVKDPVFDAETNILGTLNLLQCAVKAKIKRFIFISSGGTVYGANAKLPAKEDMPLTADNPYGISKVTGEHYVRFFSNYYGLKYVMLRYSNVYGPRQIPHGEAGVVSIFINKILKGERPVIFGGGKCIRDYVFVGDVARANLMALNKATNQAINIGTGIKTDVNKLYDIICKVTGFEKKALNGPDRPGDIPANYLNVQKAEKVLNWKPEISLEEGIKKTYNFFKKNAER
ncbi:MAG TPA: NAD-dependent epimerase/dehydratase family protein [Candidatus Goldiibacteriota bacterium]|nr:NAD-dependent epimerase/dehydratase family protein [Candidatus Goldiibacteriota bacterium]